MSRTHNTQPFPAEAMTAFAVDYHRHREDGATVHAAYYAAKSDAIRAERPYPSLITLQRRLNPERYHAANKRTQAAPASAAPEIAPPSDTPADAPASAAPETIGTESGRGAIAIALLRCYRYRSEEAIDALTDRLFPDLDGEE